MGEVQLHARRPGPAHLPPPFIIVFPFRAQLHAADHTRLGRRTHLAPAKGKAGSGDVGWVDGPHFHLPRANPAYTTLLAQLPCGACTFQVVHAALLPTHRERAVAANTATALGPTVAENEGTRWLQGG